VYKGLPSGFGIYFWRNGNKMYEGEIRDDFFNGFGVRYDSEGGEAEKGVWLDGTLIIDSENLVWAFGLKIFRMTLGMLILGKWGLGGGRGPAGGEGLIYPETFCYG
jgi:hypothetical protein